LISAMMTRLATLAASVDLFVEFRALVDLSHLGRQNAMRRDGPMCEVQRPIASRERLLGI
jgi:hypothetical protein